MILMVIDLQKVLWELFNKTGNINYYLLLSHIRGKNGSKNKRNSIKGDSL